jgi:hypothetical protein
MQTVSDIFLGWHVARGPDGGARGRSATTTCASRRRQGRDRRLAAAAARARRVRTPGRWRAPTRARETASSISGYLGAGGAFDDAVAAFAERYADQNEADYQALRTAVAEGRVEAASDEPKQRRDEAVKGSERIGAGCGLSARHRPSIAWLVTGQGQQGTRDRATAGLQQMRELPGALRRS